MARKNLLHRDIKAENIVFADTAAQAAAKGVPPIVKFIDLGMATLYDKGNPQTGTGHSPPLFWGIEWNAIGVQPKAGSRSAKLCALASLGVGLRVSRPDSWLPATGLVKGSSSRLRQQGSRLYQCCELPIL